MDHVRRTFEVRRTFFDLSLEGVIDTELDVRDTYINLRVAADRLRLPEIHLVIEAEA